MAAQPPTSWFRVQYDSLARDEGVEEFLAWQTKMLSRDAVNMLQDLVTQKLGDRGRGRGRALFAGVADGSFNMVWLFKFSAKGRPEVVLRLPKPGFTAPALVAEKLENEANWMQYMEEKGVLKVPHLYCWDSKGEGPDANAHAIGPYMLMDFVEGDSLLDWLPKWGHADEKKRDFVFEQLAEMYLRLHRTRFDRIGSITKTPEGTWAVTRRPLTQDMHQQALGVPGFPIDSWPSGPLDHAREFKALLVGLHAHQLRCLRNLNIPVEKIEGDFVEQEGDMIDTDRAIEVAGLRWTARRAFAEGATVSFVDNDNSENNDADGFIVFNTDLHARNILVDPDTAVITAVLDLEGTNAMPAAFARDPPLWLDEWSLDMALEWDVFPQWLQRYEAVVGHFLSIMERVEARKQQEEEHEPHEPPLSARMRASWESKHCLINFAAHNSDYFDSLYWALPGIFPPPDGSSAARDEVHEYQSWTRRQIAAYEKERREKAAKLVTE